MSLKFYKPTTPAKRFLISKQNDSLRKKPLLNGQLVTIKKRSGRNNSGKITVFHKGAGSKRRYRSINLPKDLPSSNLIVVSLERDPYRTANLAAVYSCLDKNLFYIIAPEHIKVGDVLKFNTTTPRLGCLAKVSAIPIGTFIYNVSTLSTSKGVFAKSAGSYSLVVEHIASSSFIKLPSGTVKRVNDDAIAFIGIPSNVEHFLTTLGKAGRNRWLNTRPTVRGVAMNPIDHPHGGGEGKTSGGRPSVTPWGVAMKSAN